MGCREESCEVMMERLKQLYKDPNPDIEEINRIKEKINQARKKSGLLTVAELQPLKDLPEMKPLKLPGEKDPTQAISTCPYCNSSVNQNEQRCPNCGQVIIPNQGQPHPRKVPQKGERYDDYGPNLDFTIKGRPIAASSKIAKKKRKEEDLAEHSDETIKDKFSVEFDMCADPFEKKRKDDDVRKEEIMKSCLDLAIDG